ncbi:hypothetical protein AB0F46_18445 [Streptomyces sp. NPDC026665]|uniref:hypothetical protein n=1 Tax=Streptomyces sp. NPDC026665 TaxID=3154798 RepID=UPI0033E87144
MVDRLRSSSVVTSSRSGDTLRITMTPEAPLFRGGDLRSVVVSILPDNERRLLRVRDVELVPVERDIRPQPPRIARSAAGLAARLAGQNRAHLRHEWAAVLAGCPEDGVLLSPTRQRLLALGFLVAALRMKVHDTTRRAWRPIDWILRVDTRTNTVITAVVGAQAIYIVDDGGLTALVTEVWEPCGGAAIALYALTRWLRRLRGIELADTRPESGDR